MEEHGVNGQWGTFARGIPGRVGYQCSNFYRYLLQQGTFLIWNRFLIESGKIEDKNYVIDEKGKAHYIFKNGRKRGVKKEDNSEESIALIYELHN